MNGSNYFKSDKMDTALFVLFILNLLSVSVILMAINSITECKKNETANDDHSKCIDNTTSKQSEPRPNKLVLYISTAFCLLLIVVSFILVFRLNEQRTVLRTISLFVQFLSFVCVVFIIVLFTMHMRKVYLNLLTGVFVLLMFVWAVVFMNRDKQFSSTILLDENK